MLGGQLLAVQTLIDIAKSAVALLITVLAIYLAVRLLGKLAKFVIVVVVVVFVVWLIFSESSFLGDIIAAARAGIA